MMITQSGTRISALLCLAFGALPLLGYSKEGEPKASIDIEDRNPRIPLIRDFPVDQFEAVSVSYSVSYFADSQSRQEMIFLNTELPHEAVVAALEKWLVKNGATHAEASKLARGEMMLFDGDIENKQLAALNPQVNMQLDSSSSIAKGVRIIGISLSVHRYSAPKRKQAEQ